MTTLVSWTRDTNTIRRYFRTLTVPLRQTHECEIIEEKRETTLANILKFIRETPPPEFSYDPKDWEHGRNHSRAGGGDPQGAA